MPDLTLHGVFDRTRRAVPDKPCLAESALSGGQVWSYAQVGHEVDDLVAQYGQRGWGPGHRVALGVGNHPRHFFHFLALNRLGVSIVPLNPDYRLGEIRYALELTQADLVVCHPQRHPLFQQAIEEEASLQDGLHPESISIHGFDRQLSNISQASFFSIFDCAPDKIASHPNGASAATAASFIDSKEHLIPISRQA